MKLAAFLLAVACVVAGFAVAIFGAWLMPPLSWFAAAIAISIIFREGP